MTNVTGVPDFEVENHGSLYLVRATTEEALSHLQGNVSGEAQWIGWAVAVEPRYIEDMVLALEENGWTVG